MSLSSSGVMPQRSSKIGTAQRQRIEVDSLVDGTIVNDESHDIFP